MRRLIILGNGFDLAHHLETSYSHFILWEFNRALDALKNDTSYEDELIRINFNSTYNRESKFENLKELTEFITSSNSSIVLPRLSIKNAYFSRLLSESGNRWVDIEYFYYKEMLLLYRELEKGGVQQSAAIDKRLNLLNDMLSILKKYLIEYLTIFGKNPIRKIQNIQTQINRELNDSFENNSLVLNFNYTETISYYTLPIGVQIINIHGELGKKDNPIIFGYGDEIDEYYQKIERLNDNNFLQNMKSFGYFKNDNYSILMNFISRQSDFETIIMGHSCGISDRLLLNTIFERQNNKAIRTYYHQREDGTNDYDQRAFEVSRQFKQDMKYDMRNKLISIDKSEPLGK
jgi:hypothetical protein